MACRAFGLDRAHSSSRSRIFARLASRLPSTCEPGLLGLQVGRVVALVRVGLAAVDLQDPLGDVVQEVPVVGHRQDGTRVGLEVALEPVARSRRRGGWSARRAAAGRAAAAAACTARPGGAHHRTARRPWRPAAGSAARPSPAPAGRRCPRRCGCPARSGRRPSRPSERRSRRPARPSPCRARPSGACSALMSATASSTFSSTVLPSVSGGSCSRIPTVASLASIAVSVVRLLESRPSA